MENSDHALVIAARSGDPRAFEELVRRHYGTVFRRTRGILGNREDALDIAQEVFLKAHRSLDQIRDGTTVRAWLGAIGVRLALNRARRDRFRRMLTLGAEGDGIEPATKETSPLDEATRAGDVRIVERELARLSPAQRAAFHLRHFEQMPFREVARCMGNGETTARVLYFQAVRRLRAALEKERT